MKENLYNNNKIKVDWEQQTSAKAAVHQCFTTRTKLLMFCIGVEVKTDYYNVFDEQVVVMLIENNNKNENEVFNVGKNHEKCKIKILKLIRMKEIYNKTKDYSLPK